MAESFEVADDSESVPTLVELEDIQVILRKEGQNRVIDNLECHMYDCLSHTVKCQLKRNPRQDTATEDSKASKFTNPDYIQKAVASFLRQHSKKFLPVLSMLVENIPTQESLNNQVGNKKIEIILQLLFENVISSCEEKNEYEWYLKLCLYAAATCLNTPIYILCSNEIGRVQWSYYRPLFKYEQQPKCVIPYVTMYMSSGKRFFKIESHDSKAKPPKADGLVGMYLTVLEDTHTTNISVPDELLELSASSKSKLCSTVSLDIVKECCELFEEQRLITHDKLTSILTAHRAERRKQTFSQVVVISRDTYRIVCQVLIRRREKKLLTPFVRNWGIFVRSCEYLVQFESLDELDTAVYDRNVHVSGFVNFCQAGGQEFDERRKKVTTAVIVSSSIGIVSGGMVIAGIILAPVSFGASLGLSIAGGVIGVGTGATAGTARVKEAVEQNTKIKDVNVKQETIEEKEEKVAAALEKVQTCFKTRFDTSYDESKEGPGNSRRGFLAVGSAMRASHSVAGIAIAAVRLSTAAANISAAILGPFYLAFDIAFLAEAAHNKAKGDKTNAGELLQTMAETIEIKCKIFNSKLRGNTNEQGRLSEWV